MKKAILRVLAILSVIVCIATAILLLLGFRPYVLKSGSMEPGYPKGSLVWINTKVPLDEIQIGDVLAYRAADGLFVMHRLVGKNLMQGDASPKPQEIVLTTENYIGREAFTLPGLGGIASVFINHRWILWGVALIIIIAALLPRRKKKSPSAEQDNNHETEVLEDTP